MRNLVAAPHDQTSSAIAGGRQPRLDGPDHQMRRIKRNLACTLTLDFQLKAGFGCLDDDLVVKAQRQPQAVETWAEVGAGRCDDSSGREPGGEGLIHQAQTSPSLATTATGSTGGAATVGIVLECGVGILQTALR